MIKKFCILFVFSIFTASAAYAALGDVNSEFFTRFGDDYLNRYIDSAIKNNHDLKQTDYKIEEYRQKVKLSFGRELPSLSVGADYLGVKIPTFDNFKLNDNAFIMPFIASYEADFFLKNRDRTKSEKKSYEAAELNKKTLYLALLSDTATCYVNILQYDALISGQAESVKIHTELLKRAEKSFKYGTVDSDYVFSAKEQLKTEEIILQNLMKQRETVLNEFAVLIGSSPNNTSEFERGTLEEFEYKGKIPSEIQSDIIFSRPDVLAAEKLLEKAKIDIRIARKEFLPTFNITGLWVFNTIAPGSFFSWESSLATLLAGTTLDLFKGGTKVANLKIQKSRYEQLFEQYRQTDLNAVKEVNTALCIIKHDSAADKDTFEQVTNRIRIHADNEKRYKRGLISYPELLTSKHILLKTKQSKARSKAGRLIDYITLYKTVGGAL